MSLLIAELAYNNVKNASIGHITFKFYCVFYPQVPYKEDVDHQSKSKVKDKLTAELRELIAVYRKNLQYAQELQKCHYDKHTKLRSYI